jgi:uncharacterized protein YwgA
MIQRKIFVNIKIVISGCTWRADHSMSVRRNRLKRLVNTLEVNDIFTFDVNSFDSRIRLQKYVYLLNSFVQTFRYSYSSYLRGPYSTRLAKDYYKLDKVDTEEQIDVPDNFLNLVKDKSTRWLEIAATTLMLKKQYDKDEIDELIDHVARNKDSSSPFVRKIMNELNRSGLLLSS